MTSRIVFPFIIFIVAAVFGTISLGYPKMGLQEGFGPGLFPGIIATVVGVFALLEIFIQTKKSKAIRKSNDGNSSPSADQLVELKSDELFGALIVIVSVILTVIAIPIIGFIPSGAALIIFLSVFMGVRPIWKSVVIGGLTSGVIFVIFHHIFGVLFAF